MKTRSMLASALFSAMIAAPAFAQAPVTAAQGSTRGDEPAEKPAKVSTQPAAVIQNMRPADQRGMVIFEAPKNDGVPYTGFKLDWGASFAQQFQVLGHENTAAERTLKDAGGKDYNANALMPIGWGFNLATANLALNAQLAPGIRVSMSTYLSSRHHQEAWVKDGYLQIDGSPIDHPILNSIMDVVTVKAGMFQLNYGDAHFRRSDNGNTLHNPFVGNLILDAWNFETGMEVYARKHGLMAMVGVTGGQNKGDVTYPENRGPAFLGKVGIDRQLTPILRTRLTGSYYSVEKTPSANLFFGDRAGSRYYHVMENTQASTTAQFTSGHINPGFTNEISAYQINPFVKLGGLEVFGVIEKAEGRNQAEEQTREFTQYAGDVVYRFLEGEKLFVGGRYNTVTGRLRNFADDVTIDRAALSAGWFITPSVLLKGEYVNQRYTDFPTNDIPNGGKFNGFVMEGVVSF
jgi:hypothetical protein